MNKIKIKKGLNLSGGVQVHPFPPAVTPLFSNGKLKVFKGYKDSITNINNNLYNNFFHTLFYAISSNTARNGC